MTPKLTRRPTRAAVARSLRELEILWQPPDKDTAEPEGNPVSAAEEKAEYSKHTAVGGELQRARGRR